MKRSLYPTALADTPSSLIMFIVALGLIPINFIVPTASIALGCVLMAIMVWKARAEYLPALIILSFGKSDFVFGGLGTWEYSLMQFESNSIYFAGFPITVNYVLIATMVLRVTSEVLMRPQTFREVGISWLIPLWYLAMIPAAIMSFMGRMEYNPSWTSSIRMVLISGGFFYGAIFVRSWPADGRILLKWILPVSVVLFSLATVGLFHNFVLWILTCYAVPMAWMALKQKSTYFRLLGLVGLIIGAAYAFGLGIRPVAEVVGKEFVGGVMGQSTFTLNALFTVSIIVTIVASMPAGRWRSLFSYILGWPAFLAVILFTLTIGILSPRYTSLVANASFRQVSVTEMNVLERLRAKVFDDRSIIWHSGINEIIHPPFILRPSGRPLMVDNPRIGLVPWFPGLHNSVLEVMQKLRWVSGTVLIMILFVCASNAARSLMSPTPLPIRVLAVGVISTLTVGCTTGHYVVAGEVSFLFYLYAGIVATVTAKYRLYRRFKGHERVET